MVCFINNEHEFCLIGLITECVGQGLKKKKSEYLRDEAVKVGVGGPLNVKGLAADVVNGLVVEENGNIGVLQKRVSRQNRVVRLNHSSGDLGRWVNGEPKLGFLSIINGKPLKQQRSQPGSGTPTHGVEDQESLEPGTVIRKLPNPIQAQIYDLLPNCIVILRTNE